MVDAACSPLSVAEPLSQVPGPCGLPELSGLPGRAVVVTGLGSINPLGGDVAATWRALREARCAVIDLGQEWAQSYGSPELPVRLAAPLAVEPGEVLSSKELRRLDRASQCALIAAREAWQQAFGVPLGSWQDAQDVEQDRADGEDPRLERLAVSIAPGMGPVLSVMEAWDTLRERGPRRVLPTAIPALMPNAPAATVGIEAGARCGIHAPVSACASGAEAIAYGADLIAAGQADVVIAGGTDAAIHPMTIASFAAMHALSTRNEDPAAASRPFAEDRDGFVLGEGAGIVILESAQHALARGAGALAVLAGWSVTADAYHVARPEPSGREQERALRQAIQGAGLEGCDIEHVNAHATSTPAGDSVEASVIARVTPQAGVCATKSATGHLLGGAGGLEAVLTVKAIEEAWMPPTLQPAGIDPALRDMGLDVVGPQGRAGAIRAAASTSFGFGGHNVALVFRALQ